MSEPKLSDLPASARLIAEVIGVSDTLRLSSALFRGNQRKLYVPTVAHLTEAHEIAQVIGFGQARRLAATFGGEQLYIPTPCAGKFAAIWADYMANLPVVDIALKHGVSARHVRRITAEERPDYDRIQQCRQISKMTMIEKLFSRFRREPQTPYGSLFSTIRGFSPKLHQFYSAEKSTELTIERVVELMVPCLPAELTIKYGDTASLMILNPAKTASSHDPLMIRVETPLTAKSMSQNSLVIAMLEALAVSMLIDRLPAHAGQSNEEHN